MDDDEIIRRYTDITSLLRILTRKEITLLDPASWEDKNDSKFLSIYKKKQKLETLLALCFTEALETNHHWKVFAPGNAGVCIRFYKSKLLRSLKGKKGFEHAIVNYEEIKKLEKRLIETSELPFLKRNQYRDEKEYRIIYGDKLKPKKYKHFKIKLNSISKIIISPLLHRNLRASLKATITSIDGCHNMDVGTTNMTDSRRWVRCGRKSV